MLVLCYLIYEEVDGKLTLPSRLSILLSALCVWLTEMLYTRAFREERCGMSGKVKMRCARCGRSFKASGSKQTLCAECAAKERAARASAKVLAPSTSAVTVQPAPAPKIVGPGASILVPGMSVPTAPQPPDTGSFGVAARDEERAQQRQPVERQPAQASSPASPKPAPKDAGKLARPPRQKAVATEQRQPQRPFELSDDLRAQVEARYLELADPVEFDGIRSQIAAELGIPKSAVKQAIIDLRKRMQLPSWWELKAYKGSEQDLARIRERYEPLLPIPPIGVHKRIAAELALDPIQVYRGIRRLRAEMRLPQYNPPETHQDPAAAPQA